MKMQRLEQPEKPAYWLCLHFRIQSNKGFKKMVALEIS